MTALQMRGVRFGYDGVPVLDGLDLTVGDRERVLVTGASGSGKSTLLGLVCGTLTADAGTVEVLGEDMGALPPRRRDRFRAARLGVVFQQFNLVPYLTVIENVLLPQRLARARIERPRERAHDLLLALDLPAGLADRSVGKLSVGQQQRVAVARALLMEPGLVVADEPTSALDPERRDAFVGLLLEQAERTGAAVLCVSHDEALRRHFDRTVAL